MNYEKRLKAAADIILADDARAGDARVSTEELGVTATLKPHQVEGVSWLIRRYNLGVNVILGDEMGLGKTLQAVALLSYLKVQKMSPGPFLVLCPLSVTDGWVSEMENFAPKLNVLQYVGDKEYRCSLRRTIYEHVKEHSSASDVRYGPAVNLLEKWAMDVLSLPFDVLLTTYDMVLANQDFLSQIPWNYAVIDEAQRLKTLPVNGRTKKADEVFRQLMKRGTQDPPSYKTLIMGHCREGTFEAGYELLVLMLRRDFVPDVEIYDSLIDGLLEKSKPLLAQKTLEKMLKSSHLPKTSTFHSILAALLEKHCAGESASFVILMLERNIRQNINLSTHLIRLLFSRGLRDKAFEIIVMLHDNGYSIKIEEVVDFLCQSRKLLEACEMLQFSLRKRESVNSDTFNQVIAGLCNINKLPEAFNLYYELIENEGCQQLPCLDHLISALEAAGRSVEAEFLSKRMPRQQLLDKSRKSRPQLGPC